MGIYSRISLIIPKNHIAKALSAILKNSLSYLNAGFIENGDLKIIVNEADYSSFINAFKECGIEARVLKKDGLKFLLKKFKHRLGLVFGLLFVLVVVTLSSKFVWSINIIGNQRLSEDDVLNELNKTNLHLGSYIPNINYKDLHNKILLNSNDISWVSVNITGSVANVYIREKIIEDRAQKNKYSNIVAKSDGQIALISVVEGKKQVSIGDVVKKGELLISGVLDSQSQGVRYVNAQGSVMAYVEKNIEVFIPYESKEKIYIGKPRTKYSYKIFNNLIFFSTKCRNYSEFCDTIEKTDKIKLFNAIDLPIYRSTTTIYEYKYEDVIYSKKQAVDLAFKELRGKMDNILENSELISKNVRTIYDENGVRLFCKLYCLEDISSSVEFYVNNGG